MENSHWVHILLTPDRRWCAPEIASRSDWDMTGVHCHTLRTTAADATSCIQQTRNWVIGSPGQCVIWVIFHVRVTGSSFWPGVRPEFFRFSKKAQNAERTFEMLKWQKSLSGVCCWTEITGCQSMQWTFTFTYFFAHKSTFGVHYGTGSPGQLDSRVTGSLGHKMWPSSISGRPIQYIGWVDVTDSMVTIRSPFCGYNLA